MSPPCISPLRRSPAQRMFATPTGCLSAPQECRWRGRGRRGRCGRGGGGARSPRGRACAMRSQRCLGLQEVSQPCTSDAIGRQIERLQRHAARQASGHLCEVSICQSAAQALNWQHVQAAQLMQRSGCQATSCPTRLVKPSGGAIGWARPEVMPKVISALAHAQEGTAGGRLRPLNLHAL